MSVLTARPSLWKGAVAGFAGGLVGSAVKALVEPPLQRLGEALMPPDPGRKELLGADTTGHPANMPPAELIRDVSREVSGETPDRDTVLAGQQVLHYTFGSAAGVVYGMLAEVTPIEAGAGVPAGAALWAATHGSVLPAVGIQAPVRDLPRAWWVWEFGSHLVFGLTAEVVRRAVRSRL